MSYRERLNRQKKVLLIDRGHVPLSIITWKKAMSLIYGRNKAEILKSYTPKRIHDRLDYRPSVIRLTVPSPHPASVRKRYKFTRRYVFLRDDYLCQYCNINMRHRKDIITVDHVIPKARGGKSNYVNCVTACKPCNQRKCDKMPHEANMNLIAPPKNPMFSWMLQAKENLNEWSEYLPGIIF